MAIVITLILIAGLCNGLMDRIKFHWTKAPDWMYEREEFWNPEISWMNKWKIDPISSDLVNRFPFSSTYLVFLTDGWHLLKEIMWQCLSFAIILSYNPHKWYLWLIPRIIIGIGFKLIYR